MGKLLLPGTIILTVVVIGLAVVLAGKSANNASAPQSLSAATTARAVAPENNQNPLAGVVMEQLGGGTIDLASYQGEKAVVVDFWASWCPNCRRDMPIMNGFYEKYKDDVEVVAINLQESKGTVEKFIGSQGFTFPVTFDPQGKASRAFGVRYTNTHILINKNGEVVKIVPGDVTESDFTSLIES